MCEPRNCLILTATSKQIVYVVSERSVAYTTAVAKSESELNDLFIGKSQNG